MTLIQKWGNSLSFRIPKPIAIQLGLEENTPVDLSVEDGRLILTPRRFSLEDLLAGVNAANIHREVDSGDPTGMEIW